jgi:hypothetical protein
VSDPVGSTIAPAVHATGLAFQESGEAGLRRFTLVADFWRVVVATECGRHIGLVVEAQFHDGRSIAYEFDNDLYDIGSDRHREFGRELEADVVAFLEHLARGEVLVGTIDHKPAIVIPQATEILVVTRGRVMTSTRTYKRHELPAPPEPLVALRDWRG